jgi:hypothetical protein
MCIGYYLMFKHQYSCLRDLSAVLSYSGERYL